MGCNTSAKSNRKSKRRLNSIELAQRRYNRPIVRKYYRPSTRITQLALPKPRTLFAAKEDYKYVLPKERMKILDKTTKQAMFTPYAQLGGVEAPRKEPPQKKWTAAEWENFWQWYQKQTVCFLSKKAATYRPKSYKNKRKPLAELQPRIEVLAIPKHLNTCRTENQNKHKKSKRSKKQSKKSKLDQILARPWYNELNQSLSEYLKQGNEKREQINAERCIHRSKIERLRDRYGVKGRLNEVLPSLFPDEPSSRIQELARHRSLSEVETRLCHKIKCHEQYIDVVGRIKISAGKVHELQKREEYQCCAWLSKLDNLRSDDPKILVRLQRKFKKPKVETIPKREPLNPTEDLTKPFPWRKIQSDLEDELQKERRRRYLKACDRKKLHDPPSKRILSLNKQHKWIKWLQERAINEELKKRKHYRAITKRGNLRVQPSSRILELAMLTFETLEAHRQHYEDWQKKTYEKYFKTKPKALKYKMSKKSRLHKLAQPKQKNELVKENPIHSAIEKKPHWKW